MISQKVASHSALSNLMTPVAPVDIPVPKCPLCRQPMQAAFRPFCSARCKQVDLGRWLTGSYVIPGEPAESSLPTGEIDADEEETFGGK